MTNEEIRVSNWTLATGTKPGERSIYDTTPTSTGPRTAPQTVGRPAATE